MSNSSKRRTAPPRSQPGKAGRPVWLLTTVLVLAGIAVVSGLVWLAQRDGTAPAQTLATQTAPADSATASGPRIAVDKELFDYGNVKLNSTIETSVHVKNVGDKLLALDPAPVVEVIEGC